MTKRLEFIASLINNEDSVIDIGTDHGYLLILLNKKGIKCMGTDIHQKALSSALNNLKEYHLEKKIPLVLTDGLNNIKIDDYNTLVIAGMGYNTIKHILNKSYNIKKIIVQSNNDYDKLRLLFNNLEYKIDKEYIIEDKKHLYHIISYLKGREVLAKEEILFGKYNKEYQKYYQQDLEKLKEILKSIPDNHQKTILEIKEKINILEKYIGAVQ